MKNEVEPEVEEESNRLDILTDDEKTQLWDEFVKERARHAHMDEQSARLRASAAKRKKRKKIADESRRRNR